MEEILKSLAGGSVPGAILAFVLWRIAPAIKEFQGKVLDRIAGVEYAIHLANTGDMLRIIASPNVAPAVKESAAALIKQTENAEAKLDREGFPKPPSS